MVTPAGDLVVKLRGSAPLARRPYRPWERVAATVRSPNQDLT
ncbi:MAG TPA: hypothetical protein VIL00_11320 [Pseudonocardiaceae bacterium]